MSPMTAKQKLQGIRVAIKRSNIGPGEVFCVLVPRQDFQEFILEGFKDKAVITPTFSYSNIFAEAKPLEIIGTNL